MNTRKQVLSPPSLQKMLLRTGSTLCLAALTATFVIATGSGVDDGALLELDGNASVQATHDWNQVYADRLGGNTAGAIVSSFVTDGLGAGDDILTGGGTKDPLDFPGWLWKQTSTTSVQDKDDIGHAYAAAYKDPITGHTQIFFGSDRFSNSGDSQMGFWFVQDATVAVNNNAKGGASGGFNGAHMVGDLLIVAHFVNGGAVPQVELFTWVGGSAGIQQVGGVDANLCNPATGNVPDICAITNNGAIGQAWTITEKSSDSPQLTGLFMEGGIDLQNALGGAPCFNAFFAETRSSASPTATLSDFTKPVPFSLCTVAVSKACATGAKGTNTDGSNFAHYTFTGKVVSPDGTVYDPTVTDTFPAGAFNTKLGFVASPASAPSCTLDATNSCKISTTGSLGAAGIAYSGSFDVPAPLPASSTANPAGTNPNQVKASAAASSGAAQTINSKLTPWTPNDASGGACHFDVNAALSLSKGCAVNIVQSSGQLAIQVDAEIRVCNTVPDNQGGVQLKGLTLTDNVFGTIATNLTLNAPNGTETGCRHFYPSYKPSACTPTADGRCIFSDTVTPTGPVKDNFGNTYALPNNASATCRVCPPSGCSAINDTPWPDNPTTFVHIVP